MGTKKQGLGRGLDALLMGTRPPNENNLSPKIEETKLSLFEVALDRLNPGPYQPRQKMQPEELESLADSIRVQGVLQPILVKPVDNHRFEIIAGERRFRAAKMAGLDKIPVIVKEVPRENALAIALIENIQRENLNPLEEAMALDKLAKEFKLTHIQLAESLGKPRTTITNSLRLLNLSEEIKALLEKGEIEVGHAKVLLGLRAQDQTVLAKLIVTKNLSVRETERLSLKMQEEKEETIYHPPSVDPDVKRLQQNLSEKLGAKLEIQHSPSGKGKISIYYNSLEELDGILDHIK